MDISLCRGSYEKGWHHRSGYKTGKRYIRVQSLFRDIVMCSRHSRDDGEGLGGRRAGRHSRCGPLGAPVAAIPGPRAITLPVTRPGAPRAAGRRCEAAGRQSRGRRIRAQVGAAALGDDRASRRKGLGCCGPLGEPVAAIPGPRAIRPTCDAAQGSTGRGAALRRCGAVTATPGAGPPYRLRGPRATMVEAEGHHALLATRRRADRGDRRSRGEGFGF